MWAPRRVCPRLRVRRDEALEVAYEAWESMPSEDQETYIEAFKLRRAEEELKAAEEGACDFGRRVYFGRLHWPPTVAGGR